MKRTSLVIALSAIASSALADRNAIDVRVRLAGETAWLDSLDYVGITGAGAVHVEVAVFYEIEQGYGFGGSIHNVVVSNWNPTLDHVTLLDRADSSQHPDGRQGRFNFGSQRQAAYTIGADLGTLRIAAANNTQNSAGGGINVFQGSPDMFGTLFDTSNPAFGFRFDLTLAERQPGIETEYVFDTPLVSLFGWYATAESTVMTRPKFIPEIHDGAVVRTTWVPAPASALVLAACAVFRRRRAAGA